MKEDSALVKFLKSKSFKALVAVIATALTAYATSGCSASPTVAAEVARCAAERLVPAADAPDAGR